MFTKNYVNKAKPKLHSFNANIHLSVMSLKNHGKRSMSDEIFLIINEFTYLFCHRGREMLNVDERNNRRDSLRPKILWQEKDKEKTMRNKLEKQKLGEDDVVPLLNEPTA